MAPETLQVFLQRSAKLTTPKSCLPAKVSILVDLFRGNITAREAEATRRNANLLIAH
jgi:hypothetical protein